MRYLYLSSVLFSSCFISLAFAYYKFYPGFFLFFPFILVGITLILCSKTNMRLTWTLVFYIVFLGFYFIVNRILGDYQHIFVLSVAILIFLLSALLLDVEVGHLILTAFFRLILITLFIETVLTWLNTELLMTYFYLDNSNSGYRDLPNKLIEVIDGNIPGLNSIYFGAQSASQLSFMATAYFFERNRQRRLSLFKPDFLLSLVICIYSLSITSIFMMMSCLFISIFRFRKITVKLTIVLMISLVGSFATLIFLQHYSSILEVIEIYILEAYWGRFVSIDLISLLFGIGFRGELPNESTAEVGFLNYLIRLGLIGQLLLLFVIFCYPFLKTKDWSIKYLILIGFISLIHYPVSIGIPFIFITIFIASMALSYQR